MKLSNLPLNKIEFLEKNIKFLNKLKIEFKENKPLFFQKKRLRFYNDSLSKINELLKEYDDMFLEELLNLEQNKK